MIRIPIKIRPILFCAVLAVCSGQVLSQDSATPTPKADLVRLKLVDGTYLVVDDAWESPQGIWYRQGSMSHLAPKERVKSIERGEPAPPKEVTKTVSNGDGPLYMRPVEKPPEPVVAEQNGNYD